MAKFQVKVGSGNKKTPQGKAGVMFPKGTPAVGKIAAGGKKKVAYSVLSRVTGGGVGKAKTASVVRRLGPLAVSPGKVKGDDLRARLNKGATVTRHGGARSPPGKGFERKDDLRVSLGALGKTQKARKTQTGPKRGQNAGVHGVGDFLRSLGLQKYVGTFAKEEIDAEALKRITDEDLRTMQIPLGPRKKILAAKGTRM
jgi:hypothetical protein